MNSAVIDDYLDALLDCAPRMLADAEGAAPDCAPAPARDVAMHLAATHDAGTHNADTGAPAPFVADAEAATSPAPDAEAAQSQPHADEAGALPATATPATGASAIDEAEALAAALMAEFDACDAAPALAAPAFAAPAPDDTLAAALMAEFDACDAAPAAAAAAAPAAVESFAAAVPPAVATHAVAGHAVAPHAVAPPAAASAAHHAQLALHAAISTANGQHVAANHRWIRVAVGHDSYALELLRVQEVVRVAPIVAMRGAGSCVLGVMNLRGRIVPVFDLGLWLGTACVQTDERSRIVVVERDDELIGVLVTAVDNVVTLGRERIEPPLPGSVPGAMVGIARVGPVPTVLLDANALFG